MTRMIAAHLLTNRLFSAHPTHAPVPLGEDIGEGGGDEEGSKEVGDEIGGGHDFTDVLTVSAV